MKKPMTDEEWAAGIAASKRRAEAIRNDPEHLARLMRKREPTTPISQAEFRERYKRWLPDDEPEDSAS